MSKRRLGVHTSIAGGIHLSVERARNLGCTTIQIFSHNPRQWFAPGIPEGEVKEFRRLRALYDIRPLFIHTSYLINLCALNIDVFNKSLHLLVREMEIADLLNADYVVLHTGSSSQDTEGNARKRAVAALKAISGLGSWKARLLLENTAGERGDISSKIKDLAEIIDDTGGGLIGGVCIDTCHAFAAGYDLRDKNGISELIREIDIHIGLDAVKLIHLNDSKRQHNSKVDRHEHIGEGGIGMEGLRMFVNHSAIMSVPLILETPKKSEDDDQRNLKTVRDLLHL